MDNSENQLIRAQDGSRLPAYYTPPTEGPPPYLHAPEEPERISLLDYWRVIVKRRWIILSFTLAVLLITAIATWKATPIYRATINLQIDPEQQSVLPFKEALDPGSTYAQSQEYLQTQFKVLESKSLAERVIKALNLEINPAFLGEAKPSTNQQDSSVVP